MPCKLKIVQISFGLTCAHRLVHEQPPRLDRKPLHQRHHQAPYWDRLTWYRFRLCPLSSTSTPSRSTTPTFPEVPTTCSSMQAGPNLASCVYMYMYLHACIAQIQEDACVYYDKIQHCADIWGGVQICSGNNSRRSRPQRHHGSDIGVSSSSYNTPQERESTLIRRAWLWVYIAATATVSGSIKDATRLNRLAWSPTRCLHVLKTRKESKFANNATMTTLAPRVEREPRLVRMPKWICWLLEVFSNQQQANHESRSSTCGCHTNQIEVTKIRSLHALYGSACMQIGKHRTTRAHACARVYVYVRVHHAAATKPSTVNSLHRVTSSPTPT